VSVLQQKQATHLSDILVSFSQHDAEYALKKNPRIRDLVQGLQSLM